MLTNLCCIFIIIVTLCSSDLWIVWPPVRLLWHLLHVLFICVDIAMKLFFWARCTSFIHFYSTIKLFWNFQINRKYILRCVLDKNNIIAHNEHTQQICTIRDTHFIFLRDNLCPLSKLSERISRILYVYSEREDSYSNTYYRSLNWMRHDRNESWLIHFTTKRLRELFAV